MTLRKSWPGPTSVTSTTDARYDLSGLIESNTSGVARAGLFPTSLAAVVTARADLNVNIAAFQAVAVQYGGPILVANDGTAQLPSPLVSPASGTNYYVVFAKQNEQTSPGTDANDLSVFGAALSTTSFALARATLPTGAIELATVQVPSGVSATNAGGVTITQTAQYTTSEGGVLPVRNSTELAAWTPADGSLAWQIDAAALLARRGGQWTPAAPSFRYFNLARNAMPDGSGYFQVPTEDATKATVAGFSYTYNGADGTLKFDTGIYLLSARAHPGGVPTGTTFMELRGSVQGVLARSAVPYSADPWMTASATFRVDGTEGLVVTIQKQTGGNSNGTGFLTVTRLSNL